MADTDEGVHPELVQLAAHICKTGSFQWENQKTPEEHLWSERSGVHVSQDKRSRGCKIMKGHHF